MVRFHDVTPTAILVAFVDRFALGQRANNRIVSTIVAALQLALAATGMQRVRSFLAATGAYGLSAIPVVRLQRRSLFR
jgi:hypothetical protein